LETDGLRPPYDASLTIRGFGDRVAKEFFSMISLTSRKSGVSGLEPPEVLVFLRIPKTAGTTVEALFERCLPGANFHGHIQVAASALLARPTNEIGEKFRRLSPEERRAVRCMVDEHVTLDVATIFDRPVRFFTVVRDPVDRAISNFFHNRVSDHLACHPFIKDMRIEEYLDSGVGLDADNHQVRILSGCAELNQQWDPQGRSLSSPPVERRHLELAKRNIEERFVVTAPMEQLTALIWFFKRLYGWPMHSAFFTRQNEASRNQRPTVDTVSAATRDRLRRMNALDMELREWVKANFAEKIARLEPAFSREVRYFEVLNNSIQRINRTLPSSLARAAKRSLYRPRAAPRLPLSRIEQ
jgi:Sulfotransferase family